ncbi:MAG: DNA polymerase III subunit gamma/tau [Pseudomonadota bacterium]
MSEKKEKDAHYQVLARKYRPQNFDDLIGQDTLVRTLKNAIESGRIAHAFMLTGIRGVGKTTTARIIAKALNYAGPDGNADPTTGPTDDCEICNAIAEDRHPDVMEMDAASRTGIDDIREILDGVRYAPTSARYKVYVIDEVHMLSKAAFNALLKTLEEPPAHVKFIFATTEIRKVPITVLSRCQRFDLRRIEPHVLADYYEKIAGQENTKIETEATQMIARAADGSVRDGLSLLDQAISLSQGEVKANSVREMLGLADQSVILSLLEFALKGDVKSSLDVMADLYKKGGDPSTIIQDMLSLSHLLTKYRALPNYQDESLMSQAEKERLENLAGLLSMPSLNRAWQILLKGLQEVNTAPNAQSAAEMVILRLNYASNLPDPASIIKKLESGDTPQVSTPSQGTALQAQPNAAQTVQSLPTSESAPEPAQTTMMAESANQPQASLAQAKPEETEASNQTQLQSLTDIVSALEKNGFMMLASQVFMYAHLVDLKEGSLEIRPKEMAPPRLTQDLSQALKSITGQRWVVSVSQKQGDATLSEKEEAAQDALRADVKQDPLIQNIFKLFPDAELTTITKKEKE